MMQLPSHLNSFKQDAKKSLDLGLVKDIEFANATYQILVEDLHNHKDCWVFLQLEGRRQIKDAICSCEAHQEWETTASCLHVATAYLALFDDHAFPLHQRYSRSLWNQLCRLYADHVGDDFSILQHHSEGIYTYHDRSKQYEFSITANSSEATQYLENIMVRRPEISEETSIKFSNLSDEEIMNWSEGHPSANLRYELSFWSDIAKWLLRLQEGHKEYRITFGYSKEDFPNKIKIDFADVSLVFHIPESDLPTIIPSLSTVKSPLEIFFNDNEGISCITFDKNDGSLHIEAEKLKKRATAATTKSKLDKKKSFSVDGWTYIPKKGFIAEEPHVLLQTPILKGEELSNALTEYGKLISKYLIDRDIELSPIAPSYQLAFDGNWNLHISCYVFHPGDLAREFSRLIGDWAYIEDRGFFHLEGLKFRNVETIIPIHQVSEFVTQNRSWLNSQEGFETHIRGLEYQLTYHVSSNDRLIFERALVKAKEGTKQQDFGSWVYLEGYGFYPKTGSSIGISVKPGISLGKEQIPLFIKMNNDELTFIHGFFNPGCPIVKSSLRVDFTDKQSIVVAPQYDYASGYEEKKIRWFDEFVYVEGEGFCEIPVESRLPEKFRTTIEYEGEERDLFFSLEMEQIRKYISYQDPQLTIISKFELVTKSVALMKEKGRGWYRFDFYYKTDKDLIPFVDILKAIKKKAHYAYFKHGVIDLRQDRFEWIRNLKKDRVDSKSNYVNLTALEFMRLNAFDPINLLPSESADYALSKELLDELTHLKTPEIPDMGGLLSHLRPYQELGVYWLWFLYHQQLSGLLCDEMGLGKTHQAMALLASIHNYYQTYAEGIKRYFLIVCPTSVMYHWQEKLQEFLPTLKTLTFYGSGRSLDQFHGDFDILLTSYGILRNQLDDISKIQFEVAIFDEIQIAKNQFSRVYSALVKIKSQMKIGLTGTPIENYLRELKSLFDIVLPTYMPEDSRFREFFVRPIEREFNVHRKELLNRMITPFVLRRKKNDVLTDLPEKTEEIAHCDLSPYQRQLYSEVLAQRRRHLIHELQDSNSAVPYMHVFALLSSLKQICDHPAVYFKKPENYLEYESGKWDLFCELLREARESNQKVVVFSHYLNMLDIIESYLSSNEIGYASLRGATRNRSEQIHKFNQDPHCVVFVGSLHAAGLGVDLTAGSVVIHYDRWWNAARENQASDRVHRIGQTRGVQIFKLVTKNTFEEKIDAMITRKGQLMEEVIGVDDHGIVKKFSREEIVELLSFVDMGEEHRTLSDYE